MEVKLREGKEGAQGLFHGQMSSENSVSNEVIFLIQNMPSL